MRPYGREIREAIMSFLDRGGRFSVAEIKSAVRASAVGVTDAQFYHHLCQLRHEGWVALVERGIYSSVKWESR